MDYKEKIDMFNIELQDLIDNWISEGLNLKKITFLPSPDTSSTKILLIEEEVE